MVKFFLTRPTSVVLVFIACTILGVIAYSALPVSLLPDISIPQITIKCPTSQMSAREIERLIVEPIRSKVSQINSVTDIRSETRDRSAVISLKFKYGTNTDLAFIEVNEKIDGSMNSLPYGSARPRVIKASASDLPVFYLNLTLQSDKEGVGTNDGKFLELSHFADNIVRKRIEQLPQVAMADMTGLMFNAIQINPDYDKLRAVDLTIDDIESELISNNVEPSSMIVKDGQYQFNVRFSSPLKSLEDIKNVYIKKGGKFYQIKDFAVVTVSKRRENGLSIVDGKRAVTIAIIKQGDETIGSLKAELNKILSDFQKKYPDVEFTVNRNQTELLDYTINNLQSNLLQGFVLVLIIAVFFLGNVKLPIINGICMTVALIISFIFFYLFKQSINIVTLSGLILALGNMMDSSIVVSDIITQNIEDGYSLEKACENGTREVAIPIFSSTLTSIAIFAPLVFMSDVAGAIFTAQALAVTISLLVSYLTGIILLPVLYKIFYTIRKGGPMNLIFLNIQRSIDKVTFSFYEKGVNYVFKHKPIFTVLMVLSFPICFLLFWIMPTSTMPQIDYVEANGRIDWNENIHVDENAKRIYALLSIVDKSSVNNAAYVGERQFFIDKNKELTSSQAEVYLKTDASRKIKTIKERVNKWIKLNYPKATINFDPPENIFEKIFQPDAGDFVMELYPETNDVSSYPAVVEFVQTKLSTITNERFEPVNFEQQYLIVPNADKLLNFGINRNDVFRALKSALNDSEITSIQSYQETMPIVIAGNKKGISNLINSTFIRSAKDELGKFIEIPVSSLVEIRVVQDLKQIVAGRSGEYIPIVFHQVKNLDKLSKQARALVNTMPGWYAKYSGSMLANKALLKQLLFVLIVSLLLMYFILAAQFESLTQPWIILAEVPIDIAFTLAVLWVTGNTLNLMSAIGLIVIIGVIINDSILKIEVMNEQMKIGKSVMEAIHIAGKRRLRAIIMTALTSILSIIPVLLTNDLGSELQRPLAIAMITSMSIGTLVSIFFIPLLYWFLYGRNENIPNSI
jgi:multidrug efflux pump subunit AcrB